MVDYIIIGAGSAGCLLANRLSADGQNEVLLLEAGGPDEKPDIRIPWRWQTLFESEVDWSYLTEPQEHLDNRQLIWNRGKVMGGSSSINNMIYIRGHRWDFDRWAELGNEEWGYDDVLPFFKGMENQTRTELLNRYHGGGGELDVADLPDQVYPVSENIARFIEAGLEFGLPYNDDFNGENQFGVGRYQYNRRNNERLSMADAFLKPVLGRENLSAIPWATVTRILFEQNEQNEENGEKRAVGVRYIHDGEEKEARARKEVILSGGVINSPQLLMLSGIGPADHLAALDIPLVVDLPGVGQNLHDHILVSLLYLSDPPVQISIERLAEAAKSFETERTGLYTMSWGSAGAFIRTRPELERPDLQLFSSPNPADRGREGDFYISISLMRPKDRGFVALRSADPLAYPIIQPNYLSTQEDRQTLIDGVKFVRRLAETAVYRDYIKEELSPGKATQTDEEILAWLRGAVATTWHYVGTCKMGVDRMAVVNPQLQVYGVAGLRIIDASVMPEVVAGNTQAATLMIAEKGAALVNGIQ